MQELAQNPTLAPLVPFVRMWYSWPFTYTWLFDDGRTHVIRQAERVEQGDPWSLLLFSLTIHASLRRDKATLQPGEYLFNFLDDVYTITPKARASAVAKHVAAVIHQDAGVEPNFGKLCGLLGKFQMRASDFFL